MTIPLQISALINRVDAELNQLEQEIQEVLQILRPLLNTFSDNGILIQLFVTLNNFQFFGSTRRQRVENIANQISSDASGDVIQEAGEELATFLGEILEARTNVNNIMRRLQTLL